MLAGSRVVNSVEARTVEVRKVGCPGWELVTGMMEAVLTKAP